MMSFIALPLYHVGNPKDYADTDRVQEKPVPTFKQNFQPNKN